MKDTFEQTAVQLVAIAKGLHGRGWLLGTSGNLSAVVTREPLTLAITPSGVDKGELKAEQILLIDENAQLLNNQTAKPSDESPLHIMIAKERGAGAIVHTHSVWNTILSDSGKDHEGLQIEDYEMLKGLAGVRTHTHRELVPIIENSQNMLELANTITNVLDKHKNTHGFLLRRHGLYTWGRDLNEAKRHVEILEFLLETLGRSAQFKAPSQM
jgi:methylthioribulose-1-phosphate dehydratase